MLDQPTQGIRAGGAVLRPPNYDKLGTDRIGEELNPDACIWRLYAEEAKDYDTGMAQERNKNLDTMLLFATLFSAIVTAFIIESTNLLEQDSSEISTHLLLLLARSQQHTETKSNDPASNLAEIPEFVPSAAVRLINVLWFASLIISLGAAVMAILAKEWLSAFISYRTQHSHKYALERQARLTSLDAWNMRPIIDLLPTVLNIALFIFSLGLIVRLWLLDFVVAGIITVISALVCAIYCYFVLAGAFYRTCPYKSQLSHYLQRIMSQHMLQYFDTSILSTLDVQKRVEPQEIDLLTWLFSTSSDPVLRGYVTQALAGLKSLKVNLNIFPNGDIVELRDQYAQNNKILDALFNLGAHAINQLQMAPTRGRNELASCGGSNIARLAVAMSEIYPYALTWQRVSENSTESQTGPSLDAQGIASKEISGDGIIEQTVNCGSLLSSMSNACKITNSIFNALDSIWTETSPALTPSAYAYLVTAELKMLRQAATFLSRDRYTEQSKPSTSGHKTVEMETPINQQITPSLDKDELQERCSRALSRAALVIKSSYEDLISKSGQETQSATVGLLLEARKLVEHMKPNSNSVLCRFGTAPSSHVLNEEISITVITENKTLRCVNCKVLARNLELMESLVELCRNDASVDSLRLETFRVEAFNLLLTFWPAYLEQSRMDEGIIREPYAWEALKWDVVPFQDTPYNLQKSAEIIIYQTIVLTYVATFLWEGPENSWSWERRGELKLFQLTLGVLFSGSRNLPTITKKLGESTLGTRPIYRQWLPTNETLEKWIRTISDWYLIDSRLQFVINDDTSKRLSWCIACLVTTTTSLTGPAVDIFAQSRLVHLPVESDRAILGDPWHGVNWAVAFVHAASQASDSRSSPVIRGLLGQVTSYIKETPLDRNAYLRDFTHGQGFDILTKLGRAGSDDEAVVDIIMAVIEKLHIARLQVDLGTMPLLLETMCYVCDAGDQYRSNSFVGDLMFQLEVLSDEVIQSTTADILLSVQKILNNLGRWERGACTPISGMGHSNRITHLIERILHQQLGQLPGTNPHQKNQTPFDRSMANLSRYPKGPINKPNNPYNNKSPYYPHYKHYDPLDTSPRANMLGLKLEGDGSNSSLKIYEPTPRQLPSARALPVFMNTWDHLTDSKSTSQASETEQGADSRISPDSLSPWNRPSHFFKPPSITITSVDTDTETDSTSVSSDSLISPLALSYPQHDRSSSRLAEITNEQADDIVAPSSENVTLDWVHHTTAAESVRVSSLVSPEEAGNEA
ncbi:embryonic skeletal system development, partial [Rhizoctonia solani]